MVPISKEVTAKLRRDGRRLIDMARSIDELVSLEASESTAEQIRELRNRLEAHVALMGGVLEAVREDDVDPYGPK